MITPKDLEPLAKSDFGKLLIEYLKEKKIELSTLSTIKSIEELAGRQKAVEILDELFSFLRKGREKQPDIKKTNYL